MPLCVDTVIHHFRGYQMGLSHCENIVVIATISLSHIRSGNKYDDASNGRLLRYYGPFPLFNVTIFPLEVLIYIQDFIGNHTKGLPQAICILPLVGQILFKNM